MAHDTYDSKEVTVIVGANIISGFAEGSRVSIERNEDSWTLQVGSEGDSVRSKSNNQSGRITITLMQTADSNDVLSALHQLDELSNAGAVPVTVKHGRSLYVAESAWVVKPPVSEFGPEAGDREWVLETGRISLTVAGS